MPGKNASDKDNQQERLMTEGWIVGFIDGEGCFSVSLHKNSTTKFGWQVMPEFVATQGESSLSALIKLKKYFGCGSIFINKRYDNHKEHLYRYCVRSFKDLNTVIVPFFKANKLQTSKVNNFEKFSEIIKLMESKEHLNKKGIKKIYEIASKMNTGKRKHQL
jgi:hypothetical protein